MGKELLVHHPIFHIYLEHIFTVPDNIYFEENIFEGQMVEKAQAGDPYYQYCLSAYYRRDKFSRASMEKAHYWLKKSADNDYLSAIEVLGLHYLFGYYGSGYQEEGLRLLNKAVEMGGVASLNNLGMHYFTQNDIEQKKIGLDYLNRAAELDNPRANLLLAGLYFVGTDLVEKDYDKGLFHLRKTDNYVSTESCYFYAILYSSGKYCFEQDLKKSFAYAKKAYVEYKKDVVPLFLAAFYIDGVVVDLNLGIAQSYVNTINYTPENVGLKFLFDKFIAEKKSKVSSALKDLINSESIPDSEFLPKHILTKDNAKKPLVNHFKKLANDGDVKAQLELFKYYSYTEKDDSSAELWYKKTIENNCGEAAYIYGNKLQDVYSLPTKESVEYYRLAANLGYAEACQDLGEIYYKGLAGIEVDYEQAFKFFNLAIEYERKDTSYNSWLCKTYRSLGKCYLYGHGVEKDAKKAFEMFTEGTIYGFSDCYKFLIMMYEQGIYVKQNKLTAYNLLTRLIVYGQYQRAWHIATYCLEGKVVHRDFDQAYALCLTGSNFTFVASKLEIAKLMLAGWPKKFAPAAIMQALEPAVLVAGKTSHFILGLIYDFGYPVKRDDQAAITAYRVAAFLGNAKAKVNLSVKYATGEGTDKNEEEAFKLALEAAYGGLAIAAANLGLMYKEGIGTVKDLDLAKEWLEKASDQGDLEASEALANFDHELKFRKIAVQDYLNFEQLAAGTYQLPSPDEDITIEPLDDWYEFSQVFNKNKPNPNVINFAKSVRVGNYEIVQQYPDFCKTAADIEKYELAIAEITKGKPGVSVKIKQTKKKRKK